MTKQIYFTLFCLVVSILVFETIDIDLFIQDLFYNFQTENWIINRDAKTLKIIFYSGIKSLYVIFVLLLLTALIFFNNNQWIRTYKKGLLVVCISTILVPLSIGALKAVTNIPCPKNIEHYNGTYPHVTLFKKYPAGFKQQKNIKCYPAGHASGGFALMSLFFLFKKRKNRLIALSSAITTGWLTGGYKMLIGDHFFSHTWVSMLVAWLIILLINQLLNRSNIKEKKIIAV